MGIITLVYILVAISGSFLAAFSRIWEIFVIACVFQFSRI